MIEVLHYERANKNKTIGYVDIKLPKVGIIIRKIAHLQDGDKKWFNLPQKEVFKSGSEKKDYYPVVIFEDREYIDMLKVAVVAALKAHREGDTAPVPAAAKSVYGAAPYCGF